MISRTILGDELLTSSLFETNNDTINTILGNWVFGYVLSVSPTSFACTFENLTSLRVNRRLFAATQHYTLSGFNMNFLIYPVTPQYRTYQVDTENRSNPVTSELRVVEVNNG